MRKLGLIAIVLCVCATSNAETIELKSGKTLQGKILEKDSGSLKLQTDYGVVLTLYDDEIARINESGGTPVPTAQEAATKEVAPVSLPVTKEEVAASLPTAAVPADISTPSVTASPSAGDSKRKLIEDLLGMMDIDKLTNESFDQMKTIQMAQMQNMGITNSHPEFSEKIMNFIKEEYSWAKVKDEYIDVYAAIFTEDDIRGLMAFYQSPVGKKFLEKTPELMKMTMEIGQKRMMEVMPRMKQMIQNEMPAVNGGK